MDDLADRWFRHGASIRIAVVGRGEAALERLVRPPIGVGGGRSLARQPPPSAFTRLALAIRRLSRMLSRVCSADSAEVWVCTTVV